MKVLGILAALFLLFRRFSLRFSVSLRLKPTRLGYVLWLEGGVSTGLFRWQGFRVQRLACRKTLKPGHHWARWLRLALRLCLPVRAFQGEAVLGLGEAASTAVACGMLWGTAGALAARIAEEPFRLNVTPDYAEKRLHLAVQCIISVSAAQIMGRMITEIKRKAGAD